MYESSHFCHHIKSKNDEEDIIFCNEISINNNSLCPAHQDEKNLILQNKSINQIFIITKIRLLLNECKHQVSANDKATIAKKMYNDLLQNPIFIIDSPIFKTTMLNKLDEFINDQINNPQPYTFAQFNPSEYLEKIKHILGIVDEYNNIDLDNKHTFDEYNNIDLDDTYINEIDGSKIIVEL